MSYRNTDFEIDLSIDSAHSRVIELVGADKDVLELGCATGYMSRVLAGRGCRVTGIEKEPRSAEKARRWCRQVIVKDLETLDIGEELGDERFDVIVCADILEHLRAPSRVLAELRRFIRAEGYVVASLPNIGHVSVLVELLEGRFFYRTEGLLDVTHVRFFTHGSIQELFEDAGWVITRFDRVRLEPQHTEFRTDLSRYAPMVVEALTSHPESTTYQFIVRCDLAGAMGARETLERRIRFEQSSSALPRPRCASREETGSAAVEALLSRQRILEEDRAWRTREVDSLTSALREADQHARLLRAEVERLKAEVERRGMLMFQLEANLESIRGSRAWRLARKVQLWGERIFPTGSRRGRIFLGR